jgi:hypothetical protein
LKSRATATDVVAVRTALHVRAEERLLDRLKQHGVMADYVERVLQHPLSDGMDVDEYEKLSAALEAIELRKRGGVPLTRLDGKPRKRAEIPELKALLPSPPVMKASRKASRRLARA